MHTISRVLLVSVLALAACGKGTDKSGGGAATSSDKPVAGDKAAPAGDKAAPAAAGGRDIANGNGLAVDAPAAWEDNGIGGAAGMHKGDSNWMIMETSPEEAAKKLDALKSDAEAMLFQKWVTSEDKAGTITLVYAMDKIKTVGDEMKKDGTTFAFSVRRAIGGKTYTCSGGAVDVATAQEAVGICNKIHASE